MERNQLKDYPNTQYIFRICRFLFTWVCKEIRKLEINYYFSDVFYYSWTKKSYFENGLEFLIMIYDHEIVIHSSRRSNNTMIDWSRSHQNTLEPISFSNQTIIINYKAIFFNRNHRCKENQYVYSIEANHSENRGVPLLFQTDSHPYSLSDLLQNHMSTSHTIRAHAKEVWDKSDKD